MEMHVCVYVHLGMTDGNLSRSISIKVLMTLYLEQLSYT